MSHLFISNDVRINPEKHAELTQLVNNEFSQYQIKEASIRNLSWRQYFSATKDCEVIVVLFAGYNLKRYWTNLVKHLLTPGKTLFGVNIEGHFFPIPRVKTFVILLQHKVKISILSYISNKL